MAGTANDHSDSRHTVDDVFQYLVRVCNVRLAIASDEILQALRHDKLLADFHIRGGAQKTRPMRQATLEELRELHTTLEELRERQATLEELRERNAAMLDHLYERAPPEGVTGRIYFESWKPNRVFDLTIKDGHLVVMWNCPLDYPWEAYSFSIANWSVVHELWPPPAASASSPQPAPKPAQAVPQPPNPDDKASAWVEATMQKDPPAGRRDARYIDALWERSKAEGYNWERTTISARFYELKNPAAKKRNRPE